MPFSLCITNAMAQNLSVSKKSFPSHFGLNMFRSAHQLISFTG